MNTEARDAGVASAVDPLRRARRGEIGAYRPSFFWEKCYG